MTDRGHARLVRVASALAVLGAAKGARAQATDPGVVPPDSATTEPSTVASAPRAVPARIEAAPPEEVTVAGTRVSRTAGAAHVLSEKKLARFHYEDPHAVLGQVPGVYSRGEDGFGLRPNIGLRGTNPDRSKKVTLMEDGILVGPAPYSAPAAYYFPMIARMTAVRVIKGPGAVAYGPQSVGGAIDLVTRSIPTETSGSIDIAAGSYASNKIHGYAGSSNEKVGFLVEGMHLANDGFKELPSGADTGFARNEWMVKGSYLVDPTAKMRNEFRLKLSYSDEVSNETYLGLTDADFRANPYQRYAASQLDRMQWHRTGIALSHVFDPGGGVTLTTTVYRNDFSRTWRKVNRFRGADLFTTLQSPGGGRNAVYAAILNGQASSASPDEALMVGPNQRDFVSQGIDSKMRWDTKTGPVSHRVEYGIRLHQDLIERRQSEDAFSVQGGALVPEGSPTTVTAFNRGQTEALSMNAIDAMTWDRLTVTPGVRIEAMHQTAVDRATHQTTGRLSQIVLPGIGAYYAIRDDLGILGGVYRGFSPLVPEATPTQQPETSVNYEGGARYSRGAARAELIGFYNDYQNLTDVCTLSSGCVDQNLDRQFDAGRAKIYGVEAFVEHAPKLGAGLELPVSAAYTLTKAEFANSFSSEDPIFGTVKAGDEMPYVPRHQLRAEAGLAHHRAGGSVALTYVSKMREVAGSGAIEDALHTDEQVLVDASGYYRVIEALKLYARVQNLFNEAYIVSRRPFGARPNAPRWIQVGLKWDF